MKHTVLEVLKDLEHFGQHFAEFIKNHYTVAAGTIGGSISSTYLIISGDMFESELIAKMIIAVCCTAVSFATSLVLNEIVKFAKKKKDKNNDKQSN